MEEANEPETSDRSPHRDDARRSESSPSLGRVVRWFARLRERRARRRVEREARRLVDRIFLDPELLAGTSLRLRHRARWVLVEIQENAGTIESVRFALVRHPRPYAFSPQHHEVAEIWRFDPGERRLTRESGTNLTRRRGLDAAD